MELLDQHAKGIMEGCKERARDAGLRFTDESLEYVVSNRDLLELSPKLMIPTLYDYWVQDVEVLKEKGRYELYPTNPYETVVNTRPPISFYNDNNPDWLNVMIFYHVLGHIDFFQNNCFFRHTWDYDLTGQALSDKRLIARLRSERGRWVDYVIEFARGADNLVAYHDELSGLFRRPEDGSCRLDFYFDVFLQAAKEVRTADYLGEVERYNRCFAADPEGGEHAFFAEVLRRYPEFDVLFEKALEKPPARPGDLLQHLLDHSEFLGREENRWMQSVLHIVRKTSLYFQPQIRTKIMNEGWASYWHEKLFLQDDRIAGHEVEYARVNARVTALPRVGLNPYALGMRLFQQLEEMADRGAYAYDYRRLRGAAEREAFDAATGAGRDFIFSVREDLCDFSFINTFVDQDFVSKHRLFVTEKVLDRQRMVWQYRVKSRKAEDYRAMLLEALYHPPRIAIDPSGEDGVLHLRHRFEGKPLVAGFIANTLMGLEFLWGRPVQLVTDEVAALPPARGPDSPGGAEEGEVEWRRVRYTMANRTLSKEAV